MYANLSFKTFLFNISFENQVLLLMHPWKIQKLCIIKDIWRQLSGLFHLKEILKSVFKIPVILIQKSPGSLHFEISFGNKTLCNFFSRFNSCVLLHAVLAHVEVAISSGAVFTPPRIANGICASAKIATPVKNTFLHPLQWEARWTGCSLAILDASLKSSQHDLSLIPLLLLLCDKFLNLLPAFQLPQFH